MKASRSKKSVNRKQRPTQAVGDFEVTKRLFETELTDEVSRLKKTTQSARAFELWAIQKIAGLSALYVTSARRKVGKGRAA